MKTFVPFDVTGSPIKVVDKKTVYPKWYWWVIALFLFWPALLILPFLGRKEYVIKQDGKIHVVDQETYNLIKVYVD